jgi:hypothetical protein
VRLDLGGRPPAGIPRQVMGPALANGRFRVRFHGRSRGPSHVRFHARLKTRSRGPYG